MGRSRGIRRTQSSTPSPNSKRTRSSTPPLPNVPVLPHSAVTGVPRKGRGARGGQKHDERLHAARRRRVDLHTVHEAFVNQTSCSEGGGGKLADVISSLCKERKQHLVRAFEELTAKARDLHSRHQELQRLNKGPEDDFGRLLLRIDTGVQSVNHDFDVQVRKTFADAKASPKRDDELWVRSGKDKETDVEKHEDDQKRIDELETTIKEGVNSAHGLEVLLKEIANQHRTLRFFEFVADGSHAKL